MFLKLTREGPEVPVSTPHSLSSSSPAAESSGPHVSLQLVLAPLAGLHVEVLEDVVFALGADLRRWHLQRVVVQ